MASKSSMSDENKALKRKKEIEIKNAENPQCSSPAGPPPCLSDSSKDADIETLMKDISNDINLHFAKYAKALSERSAVDASYIQEFNEILKEARSVEVHLKQKRESLRNRLTMIANKLQR
ncbi:testis-expressed protein 12-like [Bombina bombina]|uniref:testis-expressed protein 12-like n=1 Tax=Bombina bombina TaxID=8345 RepID=UPI00235AC067|nr:testis-expressed protein 12-like [Bombina bombina]XP_053546902.1 testis-expressed protein 12-like [Bombina bombina]XP_053546905.1 testis-expressed protein 12-like [Bombina bombina]